MAIEKKLDKADILKEILLYDQRYSAVPTVELLAGMFKVTPMTIYRKLDQLEKDGDIQRFVKSGTYRTGYELKNKVTNK